MARIRYTATARSDLGEIYRFIRKRTRSGEAVRRFVQADAAQQATRRATGE